MSAFDDTLNEISEISLKYRIRYVVTRFDRMGKLIKDDIDLLVSSNDYQKMINMCRKSGYSTFSHDGALGGRIKGMQINLVKPSRVKIDLHRDFTWRRSRYFDLNIIWENFERVNIGGVKVELPRESVDVFITLINIIFEKTYINKDDFAYLARLKEEIFGGENFEKQAKEYHWDKTFSLYKSWFFGIKSPSVFPIFLPAGLVLYSYLEKFLGERNIDIISLLYYLFFRIRYRMTGVLPYE